MDTKEKCVSCGGRFFRFIDPTGVDPWMGGPTVIRVCAHCGHEVVTHND